MYCIWKKRKKEKSIWVSYRLQKSNATKKKKLEMLYTFLKKVKGKKKGKNAKEFKTVL